MPAASPEFTDARRWLVCQLGAREHYAVARALAGCGALAGLATDAWIRPGSLPARLHRRLRDRYHAGLEQVPVKHWSEGLLAFELLARTRRRRGWPLILERNAWFQQRVSRWLKALPASAAGPKPVVFSYSYTAREPFQVARARGWRTVLGQIDPGPVEAEIVAAEQRAFTGGRTRWTPSPARYWQEWREECALADRIVVNSAWSREALLQTGIPAEKIVIVPLAYEANTSLKPARNYPSRFQAARPLRVLFLGQVNLRKGLGRLLEAARLLAAEPVEFWMVGPLELFAVPDPLRTPNLKWFGAVPRGEVERFYQEADVFLFPTLSDGFGLTQLEAQAQGLPLIATRRCGEVVRDGVNGLLLAEPTADAIAAGVRELLARPGRLTEMAATAGVESRFSLSSIGEQLLALAGPG
jgi:glycosyltransferase involved in cell wall biosynthesis